MIKKRKLGFAQSTAMAACFGLAFSASAVAPQKAEAFTGFFGFSTEACYNQVITTLGAAWGNPSTFILDWFMLEQVIANIEFWATTVCDESDEERWSDAVIKATWVFCVDHLATDGQKERLGYDRNAHRGDPEASAELWPYSKWFSWNPARIHMNADDVLLQATDGKTGFHGTTHHVSYRLDIDELKDMIENCGMPSYRWDSIAEAATYYFENDD